MLNPTLAEDLARSIVAESKRAQLVPLEYASIRYTNENYVMCATTKYLSSAELADALNEASEHGFHLQPNDLAVARNMHRTGDIILLSKPKSS